MLKGIEVLCHSSIKISKDKIIYVDPFRVDEEYKDADYIFITHEHYDHFSVQDINKVQKENTVIIIPESMKAKITEEGYNSDNIMFVIPNNDYDLVDFKFSTVYAYNVNKKFHTKENNWVGYILYLNGFSYYIAGDTDITEDNVNVKCDVALVPVGGTYTMTCKEAARLVNQIKPKVAIPTHYGEIVGDKEDGKKFTNLLDDEIKSKVLIN